jgi:hypothetical protein
VLSALCRAPMRVSFSVSCAANAGPSAAASSVRKRILLALAPFDPTPGTAPPLPPPPSTHSLTASRARSSAVAEFSFAATGRAEQCASSAFFVFSASRAGSSAAAEFEAAHGHEETSH